MQRPPSCETNPLSFATFAPCLQVQGANLHPWLLASPKTMCLWPSGNLLFESWAPHLGTDLLDDSASADPGLLNRSQPVSELNHRGPPNPLRSIGCFTFTSQKRPSPPNPANHVRLPGERSRSRPVARCQTRWRPGGRTGWVAS